MFALRPFLATCLLLVLSACATVPPSTLPVNDLRQFKLTGVELDLAAPISSWPAQEEALKADATEVQPKLAAALRGLFEVEIRNQTTGLMQGQRPVKVRVSIKRLDIPSAIRRVLVQNDAQIQATIEVVDGRGAVLSSYAGPVRFHRMLGGLAGVAISSMMAPYDPAQVMVIDYVAEWKRWLLGLQS